MPRKPKRSQPVAAPQDQAYGQRGEQMAAQRAMPLPQNRGQVTPSPAAPAPPGSGMGLEAALASAAGLSPPAGLAAPTARPDEPITAGLPSGPGPNTPPQLAAAPAELDRVAEVLRAAYEVAPSPQVLQLLRVVTGQP